MPWLPLDIEVPYQEMLEEAIKIKHLFVSHRDQDVQGGYRHKGWKSLCIHGISLEKTNHFTEYGYKSNEETPYVWTNITKYCPITTNFFKKIYPISNYFRVRFMLLEPGGYISPHVDTEKTSLSPVNIALNHPKNCLFKMEKYGIVPMKPGVVMLLDVSNKHAYINKSNEDRIHIIVHGKPTKEFKKIVEDSYASYGA
ncbi:uncharacterized protein METZ01_LOCUS100442 [marine metagenome]|uniref:Aspartyl/asparaginy/proline hydroxylase domain-containing protein n=1 Tax=marine metagenome TaxID=408172 RepID=A0A381W6K0_9ZZZZ